MHKERAGAEVRRAAAVLYIDDEADEQTLKRFTRYSKRQAFSIRKAYLDNGTDALRDKRHSNRERILTKPQRNTIIDVLRTKQPKDVLTGCQDTHWSTNLLGEYIERHYSVRYKSRTGSYLLFREAKLSFHFPGKSYEKADEERKAAWIAQQTDGRSRLMRAWQDEQTVILCEDEMVLTSSTTLQKIWLPKNSYPPIVDTNTTKKRKSLYGFLDLKTGKQHAFMTDWQNMFITVAVLDKLRQVYPTQQLLLVWDNAGWHRGSEVQNWIRKDRRTKTLHFPPYTPDLNPQEHVWKAGRKATTHNLHITDIEQTTKDFVSYIESQTFGYELCGLRPQT
jgi:transposase